MTHPLTAPIWWGSGSEGTDKFVPFCNIVFILTSRFDVSCCRTTLRQRRVWKVIGRLAAR